MLANLYCLYIEGDEVTGRLNYYNWLKSRQFKRLHKLCFIDLSEIHEINNEEKY